jgi:hypothetical protein
MKRMLPVACSYPAALFYLGVAAALADALPAGRGFVRVLIYWWVQSTVASWLMADLIRHGRKPCYECDTFPAVTWPLTGPVQILGTRGWRGLGPMLLFGGGLLGSALAGTLLLEWARHE